MKSVCVIDAISRERLDLWCLLYMYSNQLLSLSVYEISMRHCVVSTHFFEGICAEAYPLPDLSTHCITVQCSRLPKEVGCDWTR